MKALLAIALVLAGCASTPAPSAPDQHALDIGHAPVPYEHKGEPLLGVLYQPGTPPRMLDFRAMAEYVHIGPDVPQEHGRPGILVVHEWWGLGESVKRKAEALARLGYVAFCVDMYGEGKVTTDPKQAGEWAGRFRTPEGKALGRERIRAALDVLRQIPGVDPERIGAIGFCFGGTVVLELAWTGAPVKGVVSFHGNPTVPTVEEAKGVKASILVCHGADDPFVTPEALATFEKAMKDARLDWNLILYGGAVHSFTNPDADGSFNPGAKYDARSDARSWEDMRRFFREMFGE